MRLNKYIALSSGLSRRAADAAIEQGRVSVNGATARIGQEADEHDRVALDGAPLALPAATRTILLNKPVGYVVSRAGQGSRTVYDLLPPGLHSLKPIGRLDKNSSGLLLLTNDGQLANELTHPSRQKIKQYEITLDAALPPLHRQMIAERGIMLEDGPSRLGLARQHEGDDTRWVVTMHEGRNRQIRRTFAALGYNVVRLHRTQFGSYQLGQLKPGSFTDV